MKTLLLDWGRWATRVLCHVMSVLFSYTVCSMPGQARIIVLDDEDTVWLPSVLLIPPLSS